MASENNLNAVFTDIANAIRDKKGSVDTIKPINMADEILTIETKSAIYKTLEARGTNWSYAFYVDSSSPNLFYYMTELSESDIPPSSNVVNMKNMFYNCYKLTTIPPLDMSKVNNTENMFNSCSSLTNVNLMNVATVGNSMFIYCSKLTSIDLPLATTIGNSAFSYCSSLTSVNLPLATTISAYAFSYCSSLTNIILPLATTIISQTFNKCTNLVRVDLPSTIEINDYAFKDCQSMLYLILRANQVCVLSNTTAFSGCSIAWSGSSSAIYVPDDLVEQYKVATNWSTYASKIKGLSELPTE